MPLIEQVATTSSVPEAQKKIVGVERCLYYSPEQSARIVEDHQRIAQARGLSNPYFNYTDKGYPFLYRIQLRDGTILSIGPIGSFTALQEGMSIQEQTANYLCYKTMGRKFPEDDPVVVEELTAVMIDGFSENDILVLFEKRNGQGINPIAGVRAHYGRGDSLLKYILFNPSIPSSLSTFQALRIPDNRVAYHPRFVEQFSDLPERQTVCMSRLYRQDPRTSQELDLTDSDIAWEAMAALAVGFVDYALKNPDKINLPEIAVYDTHNGYIQRRLGEHFNMQVLSSQGEAQPTDEVLNTVLAYHYGPSETTELFAGGGYQEDIVIGYASVPGYLVRALRFLQDRGIDLMTPELESYIRDTIVRRVVSVPELAFMAGEEPISLRKLEPFIHLVEGYQSEIPHPDQLAPVILDHHTAEGLRRLREKAGQIAEPEKNISVKPFEVAKQELLSLAQNSRETPRIREELIDKVVGDILEKTQGIKEEDIRSLIEANPISKDLAYQAEQLEIHAASASILEEESRWIYNPASGKLTKFVGPQAHRILLMSRLLGLIPFDTIINDIRNKKFRIAGASAVARAIDLLACLGAEDLVFWDDGFIDDSNIFRIPGGMGHFENIGDSKALTLQAVLQGRNPNARFRGYHGRVVASETERVGPYDIVRQQFATDGDFVFEVIDNTWGKADFRLFMEEGYPDVPIGFLADTGNDGMFGIEIPRRRTPFNQELPRSEVKRMAAVPDEILNITDGEERARALRKEMLRSVLVMLEGDLPLEHQLQFVFSLLAGLPWSQTPIAAHDSASVASKAIISYLQGVDVAGGNLHPADAPKSLVPRFDNKQASTLAEIMRQLFGLSSN